MKAVKDIRKSFFELLNYLPGLIILIFGLQALHSSLSLIQEQQNFISVYKEYSKDIFLIEDKFHEFESKFYVYLDGSSLVDEKKLLESYRAYKDVYEASIENASGRSQNQRPEGYINKLMILDSDLSAVVDTVQAKGRLIEEETRDSLLKTLHHVHEDMEKLGEDFYSETQLRNLHQRMERGERWLYWSVLFMGLSGFVLIVLNTDKLKKLKRANEEKKESLALLKNRLAAMEAARDGIGLIDGEGNLTYMNPALMVLHDIDSKKYESYIGQPWEKLYSNKDPEVQKARVDIQKKVMPLLRKQGYWQGETPITKKDGELVNAELSLTLLPDGGFIGTVRDLSERMKIDEEKKELESQFYQAQKMEAIGRLAGGIAHDFNNILAAMNGYAEFLTDDLEEGSPQHKFALNILQAGKQARDLVDQMLAFSRRKQSTKESLDLTVPVHETLSMLKATLPKTIEVDADIDVKHALIDGNANQIAQVIMNLCVNARDAIEDDHGALRVGLDIVESGAFDFPGALRDDMPESDETPPVRIDDLGPTETRLVLGQLVREKKYVCLSIEDTGCGMSRVIMEHIFEPFFTTKPVDKGTGLGLATVHGVVTGHQGAMVINSELGKGTRFELLFPAGDAVQAQEEEPEGALQAGSGHILLVEDQDSVRDMMLNMLERLGYQAEACVSGLEALDVLRENPDRFDLVITDHNMPKMTGLELVQQIYPDLPEIPFILLSGYSQEKMQDLMQDHPAIKEILKKPVSKQVLSQKIQAVLSGQRKAA